MSVWWVFGGCMAGILWVYGGNDIGYMVLVTEPYTKVDNVAASVYAFPWMGPKSTTSFILIVRSFTCRTNHDMGPIFYLRTDARPNSQILDSNPLPLGLKSTTLTTRPREQYGRYTVGIWWVYGGCAVGIWWVYGGVYGGCTVGVRWVYGGCTVGVLWVYGGCTVGVLWVYGGCTVGVRWVYSGCTVGVWWVCGGCTVCNLFSPYISSLYQLSDKLKMSLLKSSL